MKDYDEENIQNKILTNSSVFWWAQKILGRNNQESLSPEYSAIVSEFIQWELVEFKELSQLNLSSL